jgi:hypothetical protein
VTLPREKPVESIGGEPTLSAAPGYDDARRRTAEDWADPIEVDRVFAVVEALIDRVAAQDSAWQHRLDIRRLRRLLAEDGYVLDSGRRIRSMASAQAVDAFPSVSQAGQPFRSSKPVSAKVECSVEA